MNKIALLIVLLLAACTPPTPLIVTATPSPTTTATNTPEPTPTQEAQNWISEPRNPGAMLDGEPITDTMIVSGQPQVTVQHPPAWDLFGLPTVRWPAVYKRGAGTDSQYEYNVSYLSGTFGLGQFERACDRCLVVMRAHFSLHTTSWTPGAISFSADLWPTANGGTCTPLTLPAQSPPAPVDGNEWSAVWLVTSGSADWYGRFTFTIQWPVFGADSVLWLHSIEVREVGLDYGDVPEMIECQS